MILLANIIAAGPSRFRQFCNTSFCRELGGREVAKPLDAAGPKRPALQKCLTLLQPNDSLVIWRLDALGNSLHDVILRITEIHQRGIELLSLSEPLNTSSPEGQWIFKTFDAMRQCERNLLIERTQKGMKAARACGIKLGAKPKLTSEQIGQAKALLEQGQTQINVADLLKVSRSTLYRTLQAHAALSMPETNGNSL